MELGDLREEIRSNLIATTMCWERPERAGKINMKLLDAICNNIMSKIEKKMEEKLWEIMR